MTKLVEKIESPDDLAWTKLIDNNSNASPSPVIVKMDDKLKDIKLDSPTATTEPARKQSIFGTFQRHLRMSIKAVSDSPGPITR